MRETAYRYFDTILYIRCQCYQFHNYFLFHYGRYITSNVQDTKENIFFLTGGFLVDGEMSIYLLE